MAPAFMLSAFLTGLPAHNRPVSYKPKYFNETIIEHDVTSGVLTTASWSMFSMEFYGETLYV